MMQMQCSKFVSAEQRQADNYDVYDADGYEIDSYDGSDSYDDASQ